MIHSKNQSILIVGATGATGKLLVEQLLAAGQNLKIIVRSSGSVPDSWKCHENIILIREDDITGISQREMADHLKDCRAAASCLGHNPNFKGIYGRPRKLVSATVQLLCEAILKNAPEKPVRFVLMNTAGNSNRDLNEHVSIGQKIVIGLLRLLLPPHPDNEKAADYLRLKIGQKNPFIEWVAVRPDSLTAQQKLTAYSIHASPTRSALFNSGQTSRINVAHFILKLVTNDTIWNRWKGQMPVIYNNVNT